MKNTRGLFSCKFNLKVVARIFLCMVCVAVCSILGLPLAALGVSAISFVFLLLFLIKYLNGKKIAGQHPCGISVFDEKHVVLMQNRAARDIIGPEKMIRLEKCAAGEIGGIHICR